MDVTGATGIIAGIAVLSGIVGGAAGASAYTKGLRENVVAWREQAEAESRRRRTAEDECATKITALQEEVRILRSDYVRLLQEETREGLAPVVSQAVIDGFDRMGRIISGRDPESWTPDDRRHVSGS